MRQASLPGEVRKRDGSKVDEAAVAARDNRKIFRMELNAGSTEIEAQLLDGTRAALCSAYFVCIRPEELSEHNTIWRKP